MKDFLLNRDGRYIECDIDGRHMTMTYYDDPRAHYDYTLISYDAYLNLKRVVNEIFDSYIDPDAGYNQVCIYLQTVDAHDSFAEGQSMLWFDPRSNEEVNTYLKEAEDKVWLMRFCDISRRKPRYEASRSTMERIFATYRDIPEGGYDSWECGYWNGIMGTLRWMLGYDKDVLDT